MSELRINLKLVSAIDGALIESLADVPKGHRSARIRQLAYLGLLVEQGKAGAIAPASSNKVVEAEGVIAEAAANDASEETIDALSGFLGSAEIHTSD